MHIHILTCEELPELSEDDKLWKQHLISQGHIVTIGIWGTEFYHTSETRVVIRSCWDYINNLEYFCSWLNNLKCHIYNSVSTIKWSADKIYLQDLQTAGIQIVPTSFNGVPEESWTDLIIKPRISNAGKDISRVHIDKFKPVNDKYLIQPFIKEIAEGELSAIFIDSELTHCVRKTPANGEFRVQHLYGGKYELETPTNEFISLATKCWDVIKDNPLYGRLDFISKDGKWLLSECELIEPWLHFDLSESAIQKMTAGIEKR